MNANRKLAVVTGVIFIIATAASLLAAALTPALTGADYLARISAQTVRTAGGASLHLLAAFASVGVAVALYPVLKQRNAGLALGSVVFRTLEAAFYMVAVVSLLSLLTLGRQFAAAGAAAYPSLQAVGDMLVSVRGHAALLGVFAFGVGALLYYWVFFQSRLIPRWLAGWGIAAVILMMAACGLALFSDTLITGYALLMLPIFLQEMVLAVWLIAKGFNSPAAAPAAPAAAPQALLGAA